MSKVFDIVANPSDQFQNVVVHRDLWRNNMMFLFENDENGHVDYAKPKNCLLVDFQISRYLPPAIDVLLCIHLTLSKNDRKKYFKEDVKFYYETLRRELADSHIKLKDHMSWSAFQQSLEFYKWVPLSFSGVYIPFTHTSRSYIQTLQKDKERYHQYCNVNRDQAILEMMETDSFFAEHLLTAVEEIVEYAFNIK
jgi:thiamine kinase-like enzyme